MGFILLGILNAQAEAGAAGGAYDLLATEILTGSQASITFSSGGVWADYQHLQIRLVARSDETGSSNARDLRMQLNGDGGTNYASHRLNGDGAGVYSSASTSQASIFGLPVYPRPSNPTTQYGATVIDILDINSTSKYSTVRMLSGSKPDGEDAIGIVSGLWLNTAELTSATIFANSGNLATGSRASIYGIKAA